MLRQPYISLADLTYPLYVPHRGGANILPENTMDGLRCAVELGFKLVEVDAYRLRDGGLMVMHDATTERTSNLHGRAADHTTPSVLRGRVDAGRWFSDSWPSDLLIPAFTDVLRRFGNHINLMVEAKNPGAAKAIADAATRSELAHTVIAQSFVRDELDPVIDAGLPALLLQADADADHPRLRAEGVAYLGVRDDAQPENIKAACAAGLTVFAYHVDRRHVRDRLLDDGVQGFISNDPLYLSETLPPGHADPYTAQTYWHGCLPSAAGARGRFYPPSSWGYPPDDVGSGYQGTLQGWGCPIHGDPDADRFTLTFDVVLDAGRSDDGSASLRFGAKEDFQLGEAPGGVAPGMGGYELLLHLDGSLELHRIDGGRTRRLDAVPTQATSPGRTARLEVMVTPADITMTRVDTGQSRVVTDRAHRGGYWHLGRRQAGVRFSDVRVG